jgi:hypothetical protein
MSQRCFKTFLGILVTAVVLSQPANSQAKVAANPPCPDQKAWAGKYRNYTFGFTVVIPAGLKGYWNSAACVPEGNDCVCMSDFGRFIPLSGDGAFIVAGAEHQIESDETVTGLEQRELASLRERKGVEKVKVIRSVWFRLGKLNARRFSAQFIEKNQTLLTDHIVSLHNGVEYELVFQAPVNKAKQGKRAFEKIVASWRLTPRV